MKSMTGYGRGECARDGMKFTVELNSVNRKQTDISINLPRELVELEPRIRDEIGQGARRTPHAKAGTVPLLILIEIAVAAADAEARPSCTPARRGRSRPDTRRRTFPRGKPGRRRR